MAEESSLDPCMPRSLALPWGSHVHTALALSPEVLLSSATGLGVAAESDPQHLLRVWCQRGSKRSSSQLGG